MPDNTSEDQDIQGGPALPAIYPEAAIALLGALFFNHHEGYIEFRLIDPQHQKPTLQQFYRSIAEVDWGWLRCKNREGYGVYYSLCPRRRRSGKKKDVGWVGVLWCDIDAKDFPGGKPEALGQLNNLPPGLYPSIVIDSGHGSQVVWLLRESLEIRSSSDIASIEGHLAGLRTVLHGDRQVVDLSRVFRLPGLVNTKDPQEPVPVRMIHFNPDSRFNLSDFEDYYEPILLGETASHGASTSGHALPQASAVLAQCLFLRHCRDDAATLSEPDWYKMASIAARTDGGLALVHELSRPYSGYTEAETDRKAAHALKDTGPYTCQRIHNDGGERWCGACPHWGKIKSPITLGMPDWGRYLESTDTAHAEADKGWPERNGTTPIGGNYYLNGGRLCYLKRTSAGEIMVPLCNFVAQAREDVIKDDGLQVTRHFVLEGSLPDGKLLPLATVPASAFGGMAWVANAWGLEAVVSAGNTAKDRIREAIQLHSTNVKRRIIYTHTGWRRVNDQQVFLTASGALGSGNVEVETELGQFHRYCLPRDPRDVPEAVAASLRFLEVAPYAVTIPLWAEAHLGPLCEFIKPDFSLWLWGKSGSLKSTLSALVLCHYGDFDYKTLPATWLSTANSLEKLLFLAKDVPLVIDDLFPASSKEKQKENDEKAARIDRAMGNLTGRQRLSSDTSLRPQYFPRGILIVTAEQLPSGQSHLARMFAVKVERDWVDLARLTKAQEEQGRYPHALAGYIQWIASDWENLPRTAMEKWKGYRQKAQMVGHLRIPSTVAHLFLGLDYGLAFAEKQGSITPERTRELREKGWDALTTLAVEHSERIEGERPVERFVSILTELFAQKLVYLRGKDGERPEEAESWGWIREEDDEGNDRWRTIPGAEMLGVADDDFVYLLPEASYRRVTRFCHDQGQVFPVSPRSLHAHLFSEGYIQRDKDGRYTQPFRIEGTVTRIMKIYRGFLER